jgi:UTP--glucose-1-phosphate uridylyltransferase
MSPTRAGRTAIAPMARTVPIVDRSKRITAGPGGELQFTDAIALLITEGHPVYVVVHSGGRHDPRAAVDFALEHPDAGPTLRERRDNS